MIAIYRTITFFLSHNNVKLRLPYRRKKIGGGCSRMGAEEGTAGPKSDEVTGDWRKLHIDKHNDLCS